MVYLTGDIHGEIDIHKLGTSFWENGKKLNKNDYLIILGDFGLVWNKPGTKGYTTDKYWLNWLENKSWTTLFVDGNHENHKMLYELPIVKKFSGNVGKVNNSVYHLKRGEVYEINFKKIFVMGGAHSIDKNSRIPNVSWWKEEQPSYAEFEYGLSNLENHNWEVDYILGHTCPSKIKNNYFKYLGISDIKNNIKCPVEQYFDVVVEKTKFNKFYFGHFHDNFSFENYVMLYENIIKLGNNHLNG